jgi:gliding motility-associated-like protein
MLKKYLWIWFVLLIINGITAYQSVAQCGPGTPSFNVNLSGNPDTTWISRDTTRHDTCCGATAPDKCGKFIVTLHPGAVGIKFDVCDGAIPPGALFYQVGCGTPKAVGEVLCLNGTGPHTITFCKPGNNINKYCITSIGKAQAGPPISVNDGCKGELYCTGYVDTSVTWRSVAPGIPGTYNNYLNCLKGCDTVQVEAKPGFPSYVDFEVCGRTLGGCDPPPSCDTVRAYFNSTLQATILPQNPTVCFGSPHTTITANGSGGTPPYTYKWSTNTTTQSINVNVGTYVVELGDSSGCPPTYDTVTVTSFSNTISAFAGNDTTVCQQSLPIPLKGKIVAAGGGQWFGGGGTYNPSADSLNANYTPSSAEILQQQVTLYLRTTGNGTCPPDTDTVVIALPDFTALFTTSTKNVSCFGDSTGAALIKGSGIDSIVWDSKILSFTIDSASTLFADTFSYRVVDTNGCYQDSSFLITQPNALQIDSLLADSVLCFGDSTGSARISVQGGTAPYGYSWSSGSNSSTANNLVQGSYTVTVTDTMGCTIDSAVVVNEPGVLSMNLSVYHVLCFADSTASAKATANGGSAPYVYSWRVYGQNVSGDSVSGLNADTFRLTISDKQNCTIDTLFQINQPPQLVIDSLVLEATKCHGDSNGIAKVTATGGSPRYIYSWSNGDTASTSLNFWAGAHSLTITDSSGCKADSSFTINQPNPLVQQITAFDAKCFGSASGEAYSTVQGGTTPYQWLWSSGATGNQDSASQMVMGSYYCIVTDSNGCKDSTTFVIGQPDSLTGTITTQNVSCYNYSDGWAAINMQGGTPPFSYSWTPGSSGQNTDSTYNLVKGNYYVSVTDSNGCTFLDTTLITQPDTFVVSLSKNTGDTICTGQSVTFKANTTGGTPAYNYQWNPTGSADSLTLTLTQSLGVAVTVTDQKNCPPTSDSMFVHVINTASDSVVITNNGPVCKNKPIEVSSFHGGTYRPYIYQWSPNIGTTTGKFNFVPPASAWYYLSITDLCNNTRIDSTFIQVNPLPLVTLSDSVYEGCVEFSLSLINTSDSAGNYSYLWEFGDGSTSTLAQPNYTYKIPGSYAISVVATNSFGCENEDKELGKAVVRPRPQADFTANKYASKLSLAQFVFTDESTGAVSRTWSIGDTLKGSNTTQEFTALDTGTYPIWLRVINSYSCTDSLLDYVVVTPDHVIQIPNAFMPNKEQEGDGSFNALEPTNSVFFPFTEYVDKYHLMIYDRWGELIFESFDVNIGWNGYYNGKLCQQDVYFWKLDLTFTDGFNEKRVGDVTLLH